MEGPAAERPEQTRVCRGVYSMSGLKSAGTGVTLSLTLSRPEVVAPLTDHLLRAGPRAGPACGFSGQGGLSLIYRLTPGMGGGGGDRPGLAPGWQGPGRV